MRKEGYVIITGAGSGLGRSLSIEFSKKGYSVVLVGRTKSKLDAVCEEINSTNKLAIEADVSDLNQVKKCFELGNEQFGFPAFSISCAGDGAFGKVGSFSNEDLDRVFSGSLIGTILVSQQSLVEMSSKGGMIINVMSTASHTPRASESIYCAAKWGAKGFTESLRLETKGSNVKVVAVYPGGMKTDFWGEKAGASPDTSSFMSPDEVAKTIIENVLQKDSLYISDIVINRS